MKAKQQGMVLALAAVFLFATFAANADSDSDTKTPTCKKGYVYSPKKGKCIKKGAALVPDHEIKRQGWALARAGDFDAAIDLFDDVAGRAPADPEALNGLGYSHRLAGDLDKGIAYYHRALAIDPDYLLARSYLAKGYLAVGLLDRARGQLREIGKRCASPCKLYDELAMTITRTTQGLKTAY